MSSTLRVFISSTMSDLANERSAVVQEISQLGFLPINAENWTPNGMNSWSKISTEITDSDIFVLLLGEKYGWIPKTGFGSNSGISATHLEVNKAKELNLPILPFFKRLSYNSDRHSKDAKMRDKFREEIGEWNSGKFRAEFNLAIDLSEKVRASLLFFLAETYRSNLQRKQV